MPGRLGQVGRLERERKHAWGTTRYLALERYSDDVLRTHPWISLGGMHDVSNPHISPMDADVSHLQLQVGRYFLRYSLSPPLGRTSSFPRLHGKMRYPTFIGSGAK